MTTQSICIYKQYFNSYSLRSTIAYKLQNIFNNICTNSIVPILCHQGFSEAGWVCESYWSLCFDTIDLDMWPVPQIKFIGLQSQKELWRLRMYASSRRRRQQQSGCSGEVCQKFLTGKATGLRRKTVSLRGQVCFSSTIKLSIKTMYFPLRHVNRKASFPPCDIVKLSQHN